MGNLNDVIAQLREAGLILDGPPDVSGRLVRCKVEGDREKRGWYCLHALTTSSGEALIVGSYGVWHGNDNGAQKIKLRKRELSKDELAAIKRRAAEDRKKAERAQAEMHAKAAARARAMWARLAPEPAGVAGYLQAKCVQGFGLRYTPNGTAVVPLLDVAGQIHGLQFLRTASAAEKAKRPAKEFWPGGLAKRGHFHLLGSPSWIILIAEGYATAASLHMATQYPVAVAFDAGNLLPVAEALHKRYALAKILICADDDDLGKCRKCGERLVLSEAVKDCPHCGQPHGCQNAGISAASSAALAVSGAWVAPRFADQAGRREAFLSRGVKLTDFNDLHVKEGLHVVRTQVEACLSDLGWSPRQRLSAPPPAGGDGGGDAESPLRPFLSPDELLSRFFLVYGHGGAVFDSVEHRLISLSDMREACANRLIWRAWSESPDRKIVRPSEVGFDPTGRDPEVKCNLFAGWPTKPKAGRCERLLDLLRYLCSQDRDPEGLYQWVLRWVAYPIQHPGAKMKTTVVVHGPQGAGKNLFFEAIMRIYGEYGDVLDQSAVEDKFNDWASRKLFMIADEVVARSDVYHIKNKLKALITGDRIRINPKNFAAYWERNHMNLVFLSNEAMPVVLEEDDRRHCVIWTPGKARADYYAAVRDEIANGGIEALHHYLLHLDLGDFGPGTPPPVNDAKVELIQLALDSPLRFYDDLVRGDIPKVEPIPGLTTDWYELYRVWCGKHGYRPAPEAKFVTSLVRSRRVDKKRCRYSVAGRERGPHYFLMLGRSEAPEGESQQDWLGRCYIDVREQLAEYKGQLPGGSAS